MSQPHAPTAAMCPVCHQTRLEPREIEPGLTGSGCPSCEGAFIPFEPYLAWQAGQTAAVSAPSAAQVALAGDSEGAKLCPACGHFMTRFRLSDDLPFRVERCGGCAGMWFDRGEWELLRAHGHHTRLHTLFSDVHQHHLRQEAVAHQHEDRLRTLLGEASFSRAREFKQWLAPHPQRQIVLAYIQDRQTP